ncbi:MAG TPA: hypothetical protein VN962_00645, partial [Polyangia bacterium]|nr:hypothetical protein [Polyangia bacterium]
MTTLSRWTLVALLATAGAGCGGSTFRGGAGGSGTGGFGGGFTGTGGFATGGFVGTGGFATGGSIGTGGFATGGSIGTGGFATGGQVGGPIFPDAGTCSTQDVGPTSTTSPPRPFGWTFSGPAGTDGGAPATGASADGGTGAGDGGTGPARCLSVPAAYPGTRCVGPATLQASATGPRIVFADGSHLDWNDALPSTMKPFVTNTAAGDTVWVDYEKKNTVVCPFCGA